MSILSQLLSSDFSLALEADDITAEVNDDLQSISAGKTATSQPEEEEESDIEKTSDIFGTANTDDDPTNDVPEEGSEEDTEDSGETEEGSEENPLQEEGGEETPSEESQPPEEAGFSNKNGVRNNLVELLRVVTANLDLVASALNTSDDDTDVQVLQLVNGNLNSIKTYIEEIFTNGIEKLSYDEMMHKYVSLRMIYTNCAQMLEKQFGSEKSSK